MALGIKTPHLIKKIIKSDERLLARVSVLYRPYLKLYLKLWTLKEHNLVNAAKINPFQILWVDPHCIELALNKESRNWEEDFFKPRIKSGEWDQKTHEFKSREVFQSIILKFEENEEWDQTPLFKNAIKSVRDDKIAGQYHASSEEELEESLRRIEDIYTSINEEGYKLQKELKEGKRTGHYEFIDKYLWTPNEITLSIGRNGEFLFEDGNHRLSIAKILDLERIPVRILVRHEKWQEKRNMAVREPGKLNKKYHDHPDIEYLM